VEVWDIPKRTVKQSLRQTRQLVAVSTFTRERMAEELGVFPNAIELLPNTFDPDRFNVGPKPRFLLKRYGLRAEKPVILTIARLASAERYKGYDQVLRALPAIRKVFPDVRYVLGGRGPDRPRIEALIAELEVSENVTLAGYIPEHELREHYNLCDVFAMPSKGEGFGIVFLEAAACGKAVLAGNKDGSVDAVLNGETGALVDPDDVAQITETLVAILERQKADSRSAIRLPDIMFDPEALRVRVIEAYGYEKFKERLSAILEPLLKS
jgi:glycosyltransferase involved in cell wall biosynthesis